MSIFSERLIECRKAKKKKQHEVAEHIGKSESAYSSYEQGRNTPGPEDIAKLAVYFGVTSDYLLGLSDDPNPIVTIAAHADEDLPPEAQERIREYAEMMRQKYMGDKKGK